MKAVFQRRAAERRRRRRRACRRPAARRGAAPARGRRPRPPTQVGGPQHRQPALGHFVVQAVDQVAARLRVEAGAWPRPSAAGGADAAARAPTRPCAGCRPRVRARAGRARRRRPKCARSPRRCARAPAPRGRPCRSAWNRGCGARQVEVERELLEHHADVRQRRAGLVAQVEAGDLDVACVGANRPVSSWNSVDLPAPLGPSRATKWPGGKGQVQRVEGDAFAIALGEALDLQHEVSGPGIGTCGIGSGCLASSQLEPY